MYASEESSIDNEECLSKIRVIYNSKFIDFTTEERRFEIAKILAATGVFFVDDSEPVSKRFKKFHITNKILSHQTRL